MYKEIVIGFLLILQGSYDFYKINRKVNIIFNLNIFKVWFRTDHEYRIIILINFFFPFTYARTSFNMDGAFHTDFTKSETNGGIKTIISPFVYLEKI